MPGPVLSSKLGQEEVFQRLTRPCNQSLVAGDERHSTETNIFGEMLMQQSFIVVLGVD